ncbi:MAG: Gfo/Idh/MocA family oxidoreductase [Chloroflexota bacterium]|nr:MAG: oxidoreductase [Chloroflexota bacterium]
MERQPLRFAVIGTGYWGINYVRLLSELPDAEVVIVCDQNSARLKEIERRFPRVQVTTDLHTALSQDIDAAVVATNATSHFEVVQACLKAGKHVLVEKPMTTRAAEANQLTALASLMGLKLMVGHIFLYNAGIQKIRTYVAGNDLGKIYYVYAKRTNLGPIRTDVNALWDLASHDVSIFNYLLDARPSWVSATGSRVLCEGCREDVGFMVLQYPNGILGHIHVSWADPNKERELVIVGSEARVVFNDLNPMEQVRVFEKGVSYESMLDPSNHYEYKLLMRDGDIISPRIEAVEPLRNECLHFIDCVLHDKQPLSHGQSGADVIAIMEATNQSLAMNGAPVEIKYEEVDEYKYIFTASPVR